MLQPAMHTGPNGGTYVQLLNGDKAYVPKNAVRWTKEVTSAGTRWRVWLRDGKNMLYPPIKP